VCLLVFRLSAAVQLNTKRKKKTPTGGPHVINIAQ